VEKVMDLEPDLYQKAEEEREERAARRRESEGRIKRHGWREHSFAPSIIIIHY
jgi:hypothetical protein